MSVFIVFVIPGLSSGLSPVLLFDGFLYPVLDL